MNVVSRIIKMFKSLLMLAVGLVILLSAKNDVGYFVSCIITGAYITLQGLQKIIFYLTSARHMVGGEKTLINGFVMTDLGLLSFLVLLEKPVLGVLYLIGIYLFTGVLDILRAFEMKKNESKRWIIKFIMGLFVIGVAVVCFVFGDVKEVIYLVLGIAWIVSAVEGIVTAFTKSAVDYIPEV